MFPEARSLTIPSQTGEAQRAAGVIPNELEMVNASPPLHRRAGRVAARSNIYTGQATGVAAALAAAERGAPRAVPIAECPTSAPMRQKGWIEEGRISGPS